MCGAIELKPTTVEHIKVHGASLEGNLEGDAVDRDVIVFLPPSYNKDKKRRYPVIYALHGYSIGAEQWSHEIHVPQTIEGAFAQGAGKYLGRKRKITAEYAVELRKRIAAGESKAKVAREFGISRDTLYRHLSSAAPRKVTAKPSTKRRSRKS